MSGCIFDKWNPHSPAVEKSPIPARVNRYRVNDRLPIYMMRIEKEAPNENGVQATVEKRTALDWPFFAISAGDYFLYASRYRHERTEKKRCLPHFLGSAWHFVRKKIMARLSDRRSRQ